MRESIRVRVYESLRMNGSVDEAAIRISTGLAKRLGISGCERVAYIDNHDNIEIIPLNKRVENYSNGIIAEVEPSPYGYIRIDIPRKLFYRLNIERNTCSAIIICDGVRLFIEIDTKDKVYIDPNNSNRCVFCGGFAQTFQNGIWICNRCLKDEKLNTLNTLMDIK